jgi:thymidylate kinase
MLAPMHLNVDDPARLEGPPAPPAGPPRGARIVVTGGPGAGKTTAIDLFARELGVRVCPVPEAATLLFSGGFPRVAPRTGAEARPGDAPPAPGPARMSPLDELHCTAQRAIFHVQRALEDTHAQLHPHRIALCDRGTVDGAAYWPAPAAEFFAALGTSHAAELARYDAVIFFESAAVGGFAITSGNRHRRESEPEAIALDRSLRELWSVHPRFTLVPHQASFMAKIMAGLRELHDTLAELPHHV